MMKSAYFDCASGISGDMCLGALVHAGASFPELVSQLSLLPVKGYRIFSGPVFKNNIKATGIHVDPGENHAHRHLKDILHIINGSSLPAQVKEKSARIFVRLADAEGEVHGISSDKVHFHEVGAVDAIVDIVGTVICLSLLGIERIVASPLPMGHGFIKCAHGLIPIPAPATQALLKEVPVYGVDIEGELVTPTGASIITALADSFGPQPAMHVNTVGLGAGSRDYGIPNILRVSIGTSSTLSQAEHIEVLETTTDDMNPEFFTYLWDQVFAEGALEMFFTPIQMKKGRPGTLLTILCLASNRDKILSVLYRETTTLGVRVRKEDRFYCQRKILSVATRFGKVKVKVGSFEDTANIAPEFEDCRDLALKHKVPLKLIYQEALCETKALLIKE
ncbi:MAG: nickel pincer cofactor biosynthesis protein LarC [Desulfitobacteriaceae bacterium]|nr:nickel pincer cofactor biosynthesis protein LarC [Desulfitobacteriaceae bacterium]MDD4751891.1 nickel pincer cofactor biosynthesis protein LarC [Desulfitobacteriaceae bacterium]